MTTTIDNTATTAIARFDLSADQADVIRREAIHYYASTAETLAQALRDWMPDVVVDEAQDHRIFGLEAEMQAARAFAMALGLNDTTPNGTQIDVEPRYIEETAVAAMEQATEVLMAQFKYRPEPDAISRAAGRVLEMRELLIAARAVPGESGR